MHQYQRLSDGVVRIGERHLLCEQNVAALALVQQRGLCAFAVVLGAADLLQLPSILQRVGEVEENLWRVAIGALLDA